MQLRFSSVNSVRSVV